MKNLQEKIKSVQSGNNDDLEILAESYVKGELTRKDILPIEKELNDKIRGSTLKEYKSKPSKLVGE